MADVDEEPGLEEFLKLTGSDCSPSPTFVQQLHGFSLTHSFQTNPCQRCSQRLAFVRWHGPSVIVLPTPKPLFVR